MWNEVYVEKDLTGSPLVQSILSKVGREAITVESYDEIWGRSKKPYLQKRDKLNLFIARKKGQLLKLAPDAYGKAGEAHYYFIHAYNCIYECQYCYLQGFFNTPDIVLFVNHDEILKEMQDLMEAHPGKRVWFHAGEFSDSLALSHLTDEIPLYHDFCIRNPNAFIELRTKSVNTRALMELPGLANFVVSFSLSPHEVASKIDYKVPSIRARLEAMRKVLARGHTIAGHFDPIIDHPDFEETYRQLLKDMDSLVTKLLYLSLGVVRFTKDVYREVERNYPESLIHATPLVKSFDGKVRYMKPRRMWMLTTIQALAQAAGLDQDKIYLCMEEGQGQ